MNAVRAAAVVVLGALTWGGCTPDFAENGNSPVTLVLTSLNDGAPMDSDVQISNGGICPDVVDVTVENHFKNPNVTGTGFRHDLVVERYEVRYIRSDGRSVEGVDVPFSITGNLAQVVPEESATTFGLEVVRHARPAMMLRSRVMSVRASWMLRQMPVPTTTIDWIISGLICSPSSILPSSRISATCERNSRVCGSTI